MIFHSRTNKTPFYRKGGALGLILKVRVFGTRKWPIGVGRLPREGGVGRQSSSPGGVLPYKDLMGSCGQPGYVFRDFCLKQGIDFIIFLS